MATKKSLWVLFGILVISVWVLGSALQARGETLKGRTAGTATKDERIEVGDEPGHVLLLQIIEGLAFFENGEIAKLKVYSIGDSTPGKGAQAIAYSFFTFEDGSTVEARFQRLMVADKSGNFSAKNISELIRGTGRFEGIKGTGTATGKNFPPTKGEAMRATSNFTWTYTLPAK